jgi:hypothetical protein
MNDLIRLALTLATAGGGRQSRRVTARTVIVMVAAATCAVAAIACGLAALWICALPYVGAAGAPAVVAGVLLAMCLALLALNQYGLKRRSPPAGTSPSVSVAEAARLVQDHKAPVLMAALLAGLVAGSGKK